MPIKHTNEMRDPRVLINRGDDRKPFLSNIVKGSAEQVTPNGIAWDGDTDILNANAADTIGAESIAIRIAPAPWKGNRSGE